MRKYYYLARSSILMLQRNLKRTLLTLLGIVVGTAVLVLVLSLGQGLEGLIMNRLGSFSPNTIFIEVQTPPSSKADIRSSLNIKTMTEKDRDDLLSLEGISYASGWRSGAAKIKYNRENENITLLAVNKDFPNLQNVPIGLGRFFNSVEDKSGEKVVVLGLSLANKLSYDRPESLVGEKVKLDNHSFRVVGITEEVDAIGPVSLSDTAFIPLRTGSKTFWSGDHLQAIMVYMEDASQTDRLSWRIQNILRRNHNIENPDDDDFAVRTFSQLLEIVGTVTSGINLLLTSLAGISLLVGGVGIMNVMYVTVSERIHEIGLRKALGANPRLIQIQFLFEALMLTAIGGVLGAVLGTTLSWLISLAAVSFGFNFPFSIPWVAIVGAVLVSALIGIVFGYAPAKKAAQMDPIAALKSEA
ncbi:ABC transporter permease [bacterium]|nr:ABC transporter permease [bacterium]NCQ55921.1 ABC transporter permease [Candidatus Parcubacteria bacterium]NCS67946.1 ABC transporter permease [Candidatus Peregrinibacteria bacterium]NCS96840.1 ABC transporter permease [bacterium]